MSVVVEEKRLTRVEDVAAGNGAPEKFVEIVEGELIETTPAERFHNRVASNIELTFRKFCANRNDIDFGGDNEGFLIRRNPDTLLSQDACLFKRRSAFEPTWLEFAPEIGVEVLSPANGSAEMALKRHAYFNAGADPFWLVDPSTRQIVFHFRDGRAVTVTGHETVDGEDVVSGMRISLPEIFRER